ncbi:dipicolinate synthase subunit B [Iocasia frigidifontis]|uniref:Dipicolinate synthase subunit B n=1 Tax=Iocasia fonsfrigidae TaxID=2682810 RepID=A0A8A7KDQ5_9FIRM|nr:MULTISPECIES: dipicolinate synthase subunit B [Halanaerobiaceae]AZO96737.1 dipicolinate synthase subunit B [Halocella sp. SP3-1]MTI60663.1 dipicolinate synthase subunit B [Bacillota bacterium]QTL99983.1 dipicolinate synthase subunit B [Iocasia fonsfrigidae]
MCLLEINGKRIGFALTGSHCTLDKVIPVLEEFIENGAEVTPILSDAILNCDTRFGPASKWVNTVLDITEKPLINSIVKAEPIGPEELLDLLIIAPCTGNTMAKLANGIIDETVIMAAKAQLRNERPVLLAIATNDGLGLNAKNLGILLNTRNVFFVPFGQDNPVQKKNSLNARFDLVKDAAEYALEDKQIQPVLIEYRGL